MQQPPRLLPLFFVGNLVRVRTGIDRLELAHLRRLFSDCDRDMVVLRDVRELLPLAEDHEGDVPAAVDITDHRRLRPAVGPHGRDCHDPVLVEDRNRRMFQVGLPSAGVTLARPDATSNVAGGDDLRHDHNFLVLAALAKRSVFLVFSGSWPFRSRLELNSFPPGSDEMSVNTRTFDWAATSLGPIGNWPDFLRALVAMMLGSAQPMFMAWGDERLWLYNHAFTPILGNKRPSALGRPISEVWAEAWSDLAPLIDRVFTGSSIQMADINLLLDRRGVLEEAHFSFSYNPAFNADGRPCGLFGVCTETTDQVIAQRELLKTDERLQLALSAAGSIGTWDWDVTNDRVTADSRFAQI